jgi:hypothetical protein
MRDQDNILVSEGEVKLKITIYEHSLSIESINQLIEINFANIFDDIEAKAIIHGINS